MMKTISPATCLALLLSLLLGATCFADLVTENVNAAFDSTDGEVGQSFTTGIAPQYNSISVGIFADAGNPASNPSVEGSLFLLSEEYLGTALGLSSSTSGFIAQHQSVSAGAWVFDDAITLQGNTQYWFYTQGYTSETPAIGFAGGGGTYAGGITYSGGNGDLAGGAPEDTFIPALNIDLGFRVSGAAVPEPGSVAFIGCLGAIMGLRRRKRSL